MHRSLYLGTLIVIGIRIYSKSIFHVGSEHRIVLLLIGFLCILIKQDEEEQVLQKEVLYWSDYWSPAGLDNDARFMTNGIVMQLVPKSRGGGGGTRLIRYTGVCRSNGWLFRKKKIPKHGVWFFSWIKTPNNGYPFPPKWPLKMGTGLAASAAHPRRNQIWVPPPPPPGPKYAIRISGRIGSRGWLVKEVFGRARPLSQVPLKIL